MSLAISWDPQLQSFVDQQKTQDDYEKQTRLALEKIIRTDEPLPAFPTNTVGGVKPPMRHQQIGYHWALRVGGLLLWWDPGCGKTRVGVDAIGGWYRERIIEPMQQVWLPAQNRWGVKGGVLIVAPKTVVRTWKVELQLWQNALGLEIVGANRSRKIQFAGTVGHAHIVNYESLHLVEGNEYSAVIADEIHKCANASNQTENVLAFAQRARRRLGLSGTPVKNSLESLFYQMLILDGGRSLGASKTAYLTEYFDSYTEGPGITKYTPRAGALERITAAIAQSTYFVEKKDVLKDLPDKTHSPLYLDMTPEQADYYEKLRRETLIYIQDSTVSLEQAAARMMKMMQCCQGFVLDDYGVAKWFNNAKANALLDLLLNQLQGRKIVVWAQFTAEITKICETLATYQINHLRMDGTIKSQRVRDAALEQWNNDPNVLVCVRQLSMGEGVTMIAHECETPCFTSIYHALNYSYVSWRQSQDRIHRIGQRFHCDYRYLLTENGVDSRIYDSLLRYDQTSQAVQQHGKDYFRQLLTDTTPGLGQIPAPAA
jgi:SNF2 family DNA or RNA helicase